MNEAEADNRELARLEAAAAAPRDPAEKDRAMPRDCGHFDIHIDRDGSWFYRGTPINRASLVRLFSTVLERDAEGVYWLTTPAERGRVTVDEAPFLAVELDRKGEGRSQELIFRTNVGDFVTADAAHPLAHRNRSRDAGAATLYPGAKSAGSAARATGILRLGGLWR